jgi:hypothetical protein
VDEVFRTRPGQLWGPPSLLYNGDRVSFPGVKRPGRGVDHPPLSSAEVKERVELYLYSPSAYVACSRVNLTFAFTFTTYTTVVVDTAPPVPRRGGEVPQTYRRQIYCGYFRTEWAR